MIYLQDNFLSDTLLNSAQKYLVNFSEIETKEKKFWVMDPIPQFTNYIVNKISILEGRPIIEVFSMFRMANDVVDTDWRIHSDSIINNDLPQRAAVLYLSDSTLTSLHGTAFWKHKEYGESLKWEDLSSDVYNKLIRKDCEDLDKWTLQSVIGWKKNRLISYPCNYFHSKYPNKSWKEGRKIYVIFYKYNQ